MFSVKGNEGLFFTVAFLILMFGFLIYRGVVGN